MLPLPMGASARWTVMSTQTLLPEVYGRCHNKWHRWAPFLGGDLKIAFGGGGSAIFAGAHFVFSRWGMSHLLSGATEKMSSWQGDTSFSVGWGMFLCVKARNFNNLWEKTKNLVLKGPATARVISKKLKLVRKHDGQQSTGQFAFAVHAWTDFMVCTVTGICISCEDARAI